MLPGCLHCSLCRKTSQWLQDFTTSLSPATALFFSHPLSFHVLELFAHAGTSTALQRCGGFRKTGWKTFCVSSKNTPNLKQTRPPRPKHFLFFKGFFFPHIKISSGLSLFGDLIQNLLYLCLPCCRGSVLSPCVPAANPEAGLWAQLGW